MTPQKLPNYHRALCRDLFESDQEYKGRLFLAEDVRFRAGHNRPSTIAAEVVASSLPAVPKLGAQAGGSNESAQSADATSIHEHQHGGILCRLDHILNLPVVAARRQTAAD